MDKKGNYKRNCLSVCAAQSSVACSASYLSACLSVCLTVCMYVSAGTPQIFTNYDITVNPLHDVPKYFPSKTLQLAIARMRLVDF